MTTALCMTAYDRPDLLEKTLQGLFGDYNCGADAFVIVVDGSKDSEITRVIDRYQSYFPYHVVVSYAENKGIAYATNLSMDIGASLANVVIHIDSDMYIGKDNWTKDFEKFLYDNPIVGIAAPDLNGRYMRIKRPGYDEIEYALGMVLAMRTTEYNKVKNYRGKGFFDEGIHHQFDPDICYRTRMLGLRVGIIPVGHCEHLGEGTGDSSKRTKESTAIRGGFEFNEKWNWYFTGTFKYKSPAMLRWDEYPLNYIFRKLWMSQFNLNPQPRPEVIQDHTFDMIKFPISVKKWQQDAARFAVEHDVKFNGADTYENVSLDLLLGNKTWLEEQS